MRSGNLRAHIMHSLYWCLKEERQSAMPRSHLRLYILYGFVICICVFVISVSAAVGGFDATLPLIGFIVLSLVLLWAVLWIVQHFKQKRRLPAPLLLSAPQEAQVGSHSLAQREQRSPIAATAPEQQLVLAETCTLPLTALYTPTLIIEDSADHERPGSVVGVYLEEIRTKARGTAVLVITTETRFANPSQWSYLTGAALDATHLRSHFARATPWSITKTSPISARC